jgi:protein-tyrosine-phosphatase
MKAKVLFVCVENSCRSQIAEGFARALGGDVLEAWSAGSRPSGQVNPQAIEFMAERGVDIAGNASKSLAEVPQSGWDYVITMGCGDACPFVPSERKTDWAVPDPKNLPPDKFRTVVTLIEERVRDLVAELRHAGA